MRNKINESQPEHPRFYSVPEVARLCGTSAMTIYRAIDAGEFPAIRIRGRWIVPAKAIDEIEAAAMNHYEAVDISGISPGVV